MRIPPQAGEPGSTERTGYQAALNDRYAGDRINAVRCSDVQRIAGTCVTGCAIVDPGEVTLPARTSGFHSRLVARALGEELAVRG